MYIFLRMDVFEFSSVRMFGVCVRVQSVCVNVGEQCVWNVYVI